MKISRSTSGAVSWETNGGSVVWLISGQDIYVKNDELNVIVIVSDSVYNFPIAGLEINGAPFSGTAKDAAEDIATTVFTGV